jgi:CubicO group peptidase (beta-lactamase class C family)
MTQEIHGTVAEGFEAVREEFAAFVAAERADYEGQLCAYVHGRRVVDLWAAPPGADGGDSLYGLFSSTQGAAHLVVALLVQDGTLELDRKVTYYWPEFASEGKGALTLRELLAHRAGLVGTDSGFTLDELSDDRALAERLADQRPFWRVDRRDRTAGDGPFAAGGARGESAGTVRPGLLPRPAGSARAPLPHHPAPVADP